MGHVFEVISPAQFTTIPLPGYGEIKVSLFPYRKLKRLIEAAKADAVHIPVEGALGWAARRYCLRHHVPFTTSYHTMFPDYLAKRVRRFLGGFIANLSRQWAIAHMRRFHRPAKASFVATQSLEDQLKTWGFKQPMVRLVRGVDTNLFNPGPSDALDDLPAPRLLYVGRVAVEKNIEAFLELDIPGSKIIVGEGPSMAEMKRKFPDAHFVGVKTGDDLVQLYRAADVFVFPSKTDTFGIVLVEAMACGLAVAGYDVTGPVDIIVDDRLGAVDSDLKAAVERALTSKGTAEDRLNHAQETYSWQEVARVFLQTELS